VEALEGPKQTSTTSEFVVENKFNESIMCASKTASMDVVHPAMRFRHRGNISTVAQEYLRYSNLLQATAVASSMVPMHPAFRRLLVESSGRWGYQRYH
jgi:hypothetical protein